MKDTGNNLSKLADHILLTNRSRYEIHNPQKYFGFMLRSFSIKELKEYGNDLSERINKFRKKINGNS